MMKKYRIMYIIFASILVQSADTDSGSGPPSLHTGKIMLEMEPCKVPYRMESCGKIDPSITKLCAFGFPSSQFLLRVREADCCKRQIFRRIEKTVGYSSRISSIHMDGRDRIDQIPRNRQTKRQNENLFEISSVAQDNQDFANLLNSELFATIYGENSLAAPNSISVAESTSSFVYKWKRPRVVNISNRFPSQEASANVVPDVVSINSLKNSRFNLAENVKRSDSTISKLSEELEDAKAEHRDINDISDQLAAKSQYGGGIQYQVAALKKRKLMLKDRIRQLESQLEALLRESLLDDERSTDSSAQEVDPIGAALSDMMKQLRSMGLKPEEVPPHKDSFFLSLMKALQRAGLRPNGYDFREGPVMGSQRQFPYAAKKAKFEVLKLLSAQADKLNGIGGWKLSPEEFKRYFSKAWWTVPAARDDLFMASAHLYSVRIVVLSIDNQGLDEQVYEPPMEAARATVYLCRREAHVISTALISKAGRPAVVPVDVSAVESVEIDLGTAETTLAVPEETAKKKLGKRVGDVAKEDLDAGLGLLEEVVESRMEDAYSQADIEAAVTPDASVEDDEVVEDRGLAGRRPGSMYDAPVRTRRVFVAITLSPQSRLAVGAAADALRRNFPLDKRLLDGVMRWVDPEGYHVTLQTLDLTGASAVERARSAIAEAVRATGQQAFSVRTGGLGSFWRSAGSGWGRVPRVVWLGLEGPGIAPLLRLHQTLATHLADPADSSVTCASLPFCAHITLGKTRNLETLGTPERRTLRVLAKWVQDPRRPVALQQLLLGSTAAAAPASYASRSGNAGAAAGAGAAGRGAKRERAWMRRAATETLSGRQKQRLNKLLRKEGRDLGGLNAEIAAAAAAGRGGSLDGVVAGEDGDDDDGSGEEGGSRGGAEGGGKREAGGGAGGVEIEVEALSVMEAVPIAGTSRVRYVTLERIPLFPLDDVVGL